jgi:hypothetical protein
MTAGRVATGAAGLSPAASRAPEKTQVRRFTRLTVSAMRRGGQQTQIAGRDAQRWLNPRESSLASVDPTSRVPGMGINDRRGRLMRPASSEFLTLRGRRHPRQLYFFGAIASLAAFATRNFTTVFALI